MFGVKTKRFIIDARTGAFNEPTGLVFATVFDGEQNMTYIPKFFLGVIEWIGHVWPETEVL